MRRLNTKEMEMVAGGTYSDITRTCKGCGKEFMVTAGEQEFSEASGASFEYCRDCRAANAIRDRHPAMMYEVICPGCGAHAMVPFRPEQAIYCSECFSKMV